MAARKIPGYYYTREDPKTGKTVGVMLKGKSRSGQSRALAAHMNKDLRAGKLVYVGRGGTKAMIFNETEDPEMHRTKYLRRRRVVDPFEFKKGRTKKYNLKPKKNPNYLAGRNMPDFSAAFGKSNLKW